ncbi:MAG: hypothetical protein ABL921_33885, partial [Pirellula sp.]
VQERLQKMQAEMKRQESQATPPPNPPSSLEPTGLPEPPVPESAGVPTEATASQGTSPNSTSNATKPTKE